jgi:hypothetical protein
MLNPLAPIPAGIAITNALVTVLCLLSVDVLLLCRVLAVVPPSRTSWGVLTAVYTFPVVNKFARVGIVITYCIHYARDARLHPLIRTESFDPTRSQVILNESMWYIAAADNASVSFLLFIWLPRLITPHRFATAIFLWQLRESAFQRQDLGHVTGDKAG